jgi:UDP-2-acetamido-3-amino-2,3-dideoxy-glucuronate N-acetyltransferase
MNEFYKHDTAIIDKDSTIGDNTKIWHFSHVQSNVSIGVNCTLGQNVNIGSNVSIGNYVKIQNNVSVYEGVTLEDYVFCGPSCVFTNVLLPRCEFPQRGSKFYAPTIVRKSASIGANATIVCGNTIGRYALVGAGAVVTKNVPSFALVLGNPAQIVGWVDKKGKKIIFDKNNISKCRNYELDNIKNILTFIG